MKVIDYSNTIMYKLVPNDVNLDLIYIGSTTNFRARKAVHKNICNNENDKDYNKKKYQYIRNNGGFENQDFEILELGEYQKAKEYLDNGRVLEAWKLLLAQK